METFEKRLLYYKTADGKCPYVSWLSALDIKTQGIIIARIDRLKDGLKGDWKRLKNSKLSELRINFGKGYRVYFREFDSFVVLIVAGSDKSDQKRMIKLADNYLKDFEERTAYNEKS